MSMLKVVLAEGSQDALAGYPFRDGEYIEAEYEDGDGYQVVEVNMANYRDTTAAQEQFLNASDDVLDYGIDPDPEPDLD